MISTFVLVHFRITRRSVRALGLHCPTYKHPAVDLARCNLLFRKHSLSQLTADATLPRTLSGKIIQPKFLWKLIEWLSLPCKRCSVHLSRDTKRSIYLALLRSAHLDYPIEVWYWQKLRLQTETSNFSGTESIANELEQRILLICIRFDTWKFDIWTMRHQLAA